MKKFMAWVAVVLLGLISLSFLLIIMGFRVNITDSIPVGLYRITNLKILKMLL